MIDLLGPASANAVTDRPADDRTIGADDTWWKDCTSSQAQDGTRLRAAFFNKILALFRVAIRGLGVTPDNADDMLLKCFRKGATDAVAVAAAYQPIHLDYPYSPGAFGFAVATGQLVINPAQFFVHRGLMQYSTDQFSAPNRTFATSANKTYHLRWHAPGTGQATPVADWPYGRFVLKDLADAAYNPSSLTEVNGAFDGTFDNALIARVVTNGANSLTVTPLVNRARLMATFKKTTFEFNDSGLGSWAGLPSLTASFNWSRTPQWAMRAMSCEGTLTAESIVALTTNADRYGGWAFVQGYAPDDPPHAYISGTVAMEASA